MEYEMMRLENTCGECKNFDRENEDLEGEAYCNSRNVKTCCDWIACNRFEELEELKDEAVK